MPSIFDIFKLLVKYKIAKGLLDILLYLAGVVLFLIVMLIIKFAS